MLTECSKLRLRLLVIAEELKTNRELVGPILTVDLGMQNISPKKTPFFVSLPEDVSTLIIKNVSEARDKNCETRVLAIDISKAFDRSLALLSS